MKKIFPFFLFLFIIISAVSAQERNTYEVSIWQDGNPVNAIMGNEITLNKAPFTIQVKLNKLDGVYVYAAFTDSIYKLSATDKIPDLESLPVLAMAENSFNPDQELLINESGWAYWFYDPSLDWHRFDKDVLIEGDNITGTKSIKQFYMVDSGKELPVASVTQPLYLFFVSVKENKDHHIQKELKRFKIKINWK
ncbi:MAG: hypothetical protein JST81_01355 [Bacteroidetes bacterium]|nr:hypothetical protein [Bacteroidota bacterium]